MGMCGSSMPNITGVKLYTYSAFMRVNSYSLTPRTDAAGTHYSISFEINTTEGGSWLGTGNASYARCVRGTINGHDIGTHQIKASNETWSAGSVYNYTITGDIPYSPGDVYINLRVEGMDSPPTQNDVLCFIWTTNTYTVSSGAATLPTPPTGITLDGVNSIVIANLTGQHTLNWTGATGGTGGATTYYIYWSPGSGWNWLAQSGGPYVFDASIFSMARGQTIWFDVLTVNRYGTSALMPSGYPSMQLAYAPTAPASVTVPATSKYRAPMTVSWAASSAQSGSLTGYTIQVRRKAAGSSTWSGWVTLTTSTGTSISTTPGDYTAWTVRPGDTLQYHVMATNSYGLTSAYTASGTVVMKGGIMRVKVGGVWKEGTVFVKVSGVWKEASGVYAKAAGSWRESL